MVDHTALWYDKYRPRKLSDYVWSSPELQQRCELWVMEHAKMPHIIFHGKPGTGKTTLALLLAEEIVTDGHDLLFINTTKQGGVESIREHVVNFCDTGGFSGVKIVIIDEGDRLTSAGQDAMRGVINDYGQSVRFILTANNIKGISDALKSRCRSYEIEQLDQGQFSERLLNISVAESIMPEDPTSPDTPLFIQAIESIISKVYPDLRKAIDMLQDGVYDDTLKPSLLLDNMDTAPWTEPLGRMITTSAPFNVIRPYTVGLSINEIAEAYSYFNKNIETWFENSYQQRVAVILIANYFAKHSSSVIPSIILDGLINELIMLKDQK